PGVDRAEVVPQRPADGSDFRISPGGAIPFLVDQAEQEGPDEQSVEVVSLRGYALLEQPGRFGRKRVVLLRRSLPTAALLAEDGVAEPERGYRNDHRVGNPGRLLDQMDQRAEGGPEHFVGQRRLRLLGVLERRVDLT